MNRLLFAIIISIILQILSGSSFSQYPPPRTDPIVIQIVELKHADAEELAEALRPFLTREGRITAYSPSNSLIIKDRKSIVRELVRVIKGRLSNDE